MLINLVKSKSTISKFRRFIYFFLAVLFLPSCFVKIHLPPTNQGACTFTFLHVFEGCFNKLSSNTLITYKGTFTIYYVNGNDWEQLNTQNFTSSATNPSTTLAITANIPKDNTQWAYEIAIQGTQCSTCAAAFYPNDFCVQNVTGAGKTAAQPARWGKTRTIVGYVSAVTLNFNDLEIIQNVAGSCGCIVPN